MAYDEAHREETQRRIDATIARAKVCHMSNTKWWKLLTDLKHLGIGPVRCKFLRDSRVFLQPIPDYDSLPKYKFGDGVLCPHRPFREIEWIEIPAEQARGLSEWLATVAQFPVEQRDSGLRVIGYTW
jgi:hypothetical protein